MVFICIKLAIKNMKELGKKIIHLVMVFIIIHQEIFMKVKYKMAKEMVMDNIIIGNIKINQFIFFFIALFYISNGDVYKGSWKDD